jgi:hypothetical protein
MSEYSVDVAKDGPTLRFRFHSKDGPVRALTLAVVDVSNRQFLWLLNSVDSSGMMTLGMDPSLEERARAQADRSAKDEMRPFAIKMFGSVANKAVTSVVYGDVPDGFAQGLPKRGSPADLVPGVTYAICLWGAFDGSHAFMIEGDTARLVTVTDEEEG